MEVMGLGAPARGPRDPDAGVGVKRMSGSMYLTRKCIRGNEHVLGSALSHPFFGWEGSPTKIDYRKRVPLFEPLYWRT